VPDELHERLRARAQQTGASVNTLLVQAATIRLAMPEEKAAAVLARLAGRADPIHRA
jgi:hypothetical protein